MAGARPENLEGQGMRLQPLEMPGVCSFKLGIWLGIHLISATGANEKQIDS